MPTSRKRAEGVTEQNARIEMIGSIMAPGVTRPIPSRFKFPSTALDRSFAGPTGIVSKFFGRFVLSLSKDSGRSLTLNPAVGYNLKREALISALLPKGEGS